MPYHKQRSAAKNGRASRTNWLFAAACALATSCALFLNSDRDDDGVAAAVPQAVVHHRRGAARAPAAARAWPPPRALALAVLVLAATSGKGCGLTLVAGAPTASPTGSPGIAADTVSTWADEIAAVFTRASKNVLLTEELQDLYDAGAYVKTLVGSAPKTAGSAPRPFRWPLRRGKKASHW